MYKYVNDITGCATSPGAISGMICHPNDSQWFNTHDVDCKAMPDGTIVTFCRRCGAIIQVHRSEGK